MPFSLPSSPSSVRLARAAGIFITAAAAGANLGLSVFLIPRLLESPVGVMLRQWQRMFESCKRSFVTAGVVATLLNVHVAAAAAQKTTRLLPWAAAFLSISFVPYTLAVLVPTNNMLLARAKKVDASEKTLEEENVFTADEIKSTRYLVDRWGVLNIGRSVLLAASAIVALAA